MKNSWCIFGMLLPLSAFCQKPDTVNAAASHKIELGVQISPAYSYRTISPDQSASSQVVSSSRNGNEIYKLTYSASLVFRYLLNKKITLSAGASYSDKGYKTKNIVLVYSSGQSVRGFVYTTSQYSPSYFPTSESFIYHYNYLDVPLKVSYYFNTTKVNFFASAGLSVNIHLSDYVTAITGFSDGSSTTTSSASTNDEFSLINFQAVAGLGVSYSLSKKISVLLEPEANYSINSIISAPIKEYLYSIGINTGVLLKL